MSILNYIDIETIPDQREGAKERAGDLVKHPANMSKQETIDKWEIEKKPALVDEAWLKTSLNGAYGEIISAALAVGDGEIISVSRDLGGSEGDMLQTLFDCIGADNKTPPFYIEHNVTFDLKFIWQRSVILGIKPPFDINWQGRHGQHYFDNMQAWAGFREYIKQDLLCELLGIKSTLEFNMDGSQVWSEVEAGNISKVAEYNRDDVYKAREIYKKLNYIK